MNLLAHRNAVAAAHKLLDNHNINNWKGQSLQCKHKGSDAFTGVMRGANHVFTTAEDRMHKMQRFYSVNIVVVDWSKCHISFFWRTRVANKKKDKNLLGLGQALKNIPTIDLMVLNWNWAINWFIELIRSCSRRFICGKIWILFPSTQPSWAFFVRSKVCLAFSRNEQNNYRYMSYERGASYASARRMRSASTLHYAYTSG